MHDGIEILVHPIRSPVTVPTALLLPPSTFEVTFSVCMYSEDPEF